MTPARAWGAAVLATLAPLALAAQAGGGISVGAVKLANGSSQRDVNGIIGIQPRTWLSITATVSAVHIAVTDSGPPRTSDGLGDLPITIGAAHTFPGRAETELGATLDLSLPTGDASAGLGTGAFAMSGGIGAGTALSPRIRVAAAASRELTGAAGTSALTPSRATSLAFEGQMMVTPRWAAVLALAADVGPRDSTLALDRSIGIGGRYTVRGPIVLTMDAAKGLSLGAPRWAFAVGFGTSFGGNNPAGGALSSRRISHGVSAAVGRGQGSGHVGHGHP